MIDTFQSNGLIYRCLQFAWVDKMLFNELERMVIVLLFSYLIAGT